MLVDDIGLFGRVFFEVVELELGDRSIGKSFGDDDIPGGFFAVFGELPVSGAVAEVSAATIVLLDKRGASFCFWFAEEGVKDIFTVTTGGFGD